MFRVRLCEGVNLQPASTEPHVVGHFSSRRELWRRFSFLSHPHVSSPSHVTLIITGGTGLQSSLRVRVEAIRKARENCRFGAIPPSKDSHSILHTSVNNFVKIFEYDIVTLHWLLHLPHSHIHIVRNPILLWQLILSQNLKLRSMC